VQGRLALKYAVQAYFCVLTSGQCFDITLETHHLPGVFVVADATRAVFFW
jgi:hypothetical protein